MSRSVQDNPIDTPYPLRASFTLGEAEQRIALSQAAVAAGCQIAPEGDGSRPAGAACLPVDTIDIAKLDQLVSSAWTNDQVGISR